MISSMDSLVSMGVVQVTLDPQQRCLVLELQLEVAPNAASVPYLLKFMFRYKVRSAG